MILSPIDVKIDYLKNDIREWPLVENGKILSRTCYDEECKITNYWRVQIYFKSGSVGKILHLVFLNKVILKPEVRPTQIKLKTSKYRVSQKLDILWYDLYNSKR